jgi:hypothetical protein
MRAMNRILHPRVRTQVRSRLSPVALAILLLAAAASAFPAYAQPSQPESQTQQRIEVTGARFREQAGKTSLSGDELARLPGTAGDPMRGIQSLPGVASIDDASGEPAVRGSRPGDNTYVVDFLPVGYLFHTGGLASVFHPGLIRRFSMSSAAWGPEYGNVVGAVFDIELKAPRTDRQGGSAEFSLLGGSVLAEGPIGDRLAFFLAARRSWFDLVQRRGEDKDEGVTFTTPVYSDSQGRLLWSLAPTQRLRLDFSTASDRSEFSVVQGGKAAQRDPILAGNSQERQSFATGALVWEGEFGNTVSTRAAIGRMRQNTDWRFGGAGTVRLRQTTDYLRSQATWVLGRAHELSVGAAVDSRLVDARLNFNFPRCTEFDPNCDISTTPRLVTDQRARQNTVALHTSDRWTFAPGWVATLGLRASREAYLDRNSLEPRAALEWNPSAASTWSLALGRHSQPPAGEESLAVVGNPKLAPIRSNHLALGHTRRLAAGWSWRVEAYAKSFDGYAVADPELNYRNGARGSAQGVELLVKRDPAPSARLTGFASLSLSRSRREVQASGERFPFDYDQPVIATLALQWKHSEAWRFGLKWSAHSGSPFTPVVDTGLFPDGRVRPIYGRINSERLPAYHRLDLRADWQATPRLAVFFEAINAYNQRNVGGYSYSPDYRKREEVRQLPLLPSAGLRYEF